MKKFVQSLLTLGTLVLLTAVSCTKVNEFDTDQYSTEKVVLQAYGPQPVVRGGVLRFVGSNLDKVVSVTIPDNNVITDIQVIAAGTHSEIRVTVPKETSAPGYPVLTLADGTTLTGKTQLTYSEPISIDSVSPAEALPGTVITIKGDYLNLIHEAIFAEKCYVSETEFVSHDRYTIQVKVPVKAQTGKIGLGTIDEQKVEDKDLLAELNIIETEEPFVVTTAKGTVAKKTYKAGETVTINGTNLDITDFVDLEGAIVTDFTATASTLTFVLPATATDGEVNLAMASGVEVPAGSIETVVPVVSGVTPSPVKNGAEVTLVGSDLDLVTGLDFLHATGAEFTYADGKITATVPEAAYAGEITLNLANGKSVEADLVLVEPKITGFSANPAAAGSDVIITGTDLDLVAAVTFAGGIKVDVEATETEIVVAVPTTAESGALVLNLKSGAQLDAEELAIDKPAGAYIPVLPEDVFSPGDMLIVELANAGKLKSVLINDEEVNFIVGGETLYVQIPFGAPVGTTITLVSDEGAVTYVLNIDPGTEITWVLWEGNEDMGSWDNQPYIGAYGSLLENGAVPGDAIRIYYAPKGEWYQFQIYDGNWGGMSFDELNGGQTVSPETWPEYTGYFEFRLTGYQIDRLNAIENWGGLFVVQGENCIITAVTLTHFIPQETPIWEGSSVVTWGGGAVTDLSWGGYDWSTVEPGTVLVAHYTIDDPSGCIRFGNGSWASLPSLAGLAEDGNLPLQEGGFEFTLTAEDLAVLVNEGGLVVCGTGYTISQIALKK